MQCADTHWRDEAIAGPNEVWISCFSVMLDLVHPKKDNMVSVGLDNPPLLLRIAVAAVGACGFLAAVRDQELAKQTYLQNKSARTSWLFLHRCYLQWFGWVLHMVYCTRIWFKNTWLKGKASSVSAMLHFSPVIPTSIDSHTLPQSPSWWKISKNTCFVDQLGMGLVHCKITWHMKGHKITNHHRSCLRSSKPILDSGLVLRVRDAQIQQYYSNSCKKVRCFRKMCTMVWQVSDTYFSLEERMWFGRVHDKVKNIE